MFHVMLAFPLLIILGVVISALLFGILAIITSIVGGAAAAYLVKSKLSRRLLFVGFGILSFVGLLPVLPFILSYINTPPSYTSAAVIMMLLCICVLSIVGIKLSNTISNKVVKISFVVVFCIVLIFALTLLILTPIIGSILTAN